MVRPADAALVLDAGAVIALARGDRRLRALLDTAQRRGASVIVPASVLAETVRGNGPRDAAINLVVNRLAPHPVVDDRLARAAGALMGRARSGNAMDAFVAAEAARQAPAVVLTSDPDDLAALLDGMPGTAVAAVSAVAPGRRSARRQRQE